jgi:hypothetical protein
LHTSLLAWNNAGPPEGQHILFQLVCRNNKFHDLAEIVVCNSFLEAEASAFELFPSILPIGPLFADSEFRKPVGNFLSEDTRCLKWLDARPDGSVVYAAFGSMAIFDPRQFQELAEGLELTGRPFLWVVRPDFAAGLSKPWLDEYQQRVAGTGMIVSWCPQQQVMLECLLFTYHYRAIGAHHDIRFCLVPAGSGAPCGGVLRVALRVELDHGGGPERCSRPVLAILQRSVPEPELRRRCVEDRPRGFAR